MIARELNIPVMPATKAATFVKPLTSAERAEAQKWHRSILGGGAMNRVLVELTFQSLKPVDTKAEVVSDPKLVREIGSLTQTRLFGYYQRDLPYEDDAWARSEGRGDVLRQAARGRCPQGRRPGGQ